MSIRGIVFLATISMFISLLSGCSETPESHVPHDKSRDESLGSESSNAGESMNLRTDNDFNSLALSDEQAQELLNVKLESPNKKIKLESVIVPSYIPQNYEVKYLETSSFLKNTDYLYGYYKILYKEESSDSCFLVSGSALDTFDPAGAGPARVEVIKEVEAKKLGIDIELGFIEFDKATNSNLFLSVLVGGGEFVGSAYVFASPAEDHCTNSVSSLDASKIIASMQHLSPSKSYNLQYLNNLLSTSF